VNYSGLNKEEYVQLLEIQQRKIQHLEFELKQLKRAIFGSKSERFVGNSSNGHPGQLNLFEGESKEPEPFEKIVVPEHEKRKQKPKRKKLAEHLAREVEVIEPEADTAKMRCIGKQITEKLEAVPTTLFVREIQRLKYIDQQGKIHIAAMPNEPFPKSIAGPSFAAKIAVDKYIDHLPLYRQSKIYAREQIDLSRSTLNNIIARGNRLLQPLYEAIKRNLLLQQYLTADESSIRVLNKNTEKGSIKGCMLVMASPTKKLVIFQYIKTKEKANILAALNGMEGHLQVDGNTSYEELGKSPKITLLYCMAHGRRYFEKALEYDRQKAEWALSCIKALYQIERRIKELSIAEKLKIRQEKSVPLLNKFKEWLEKHLALNEPTNPIQKAIRYFLKRWNGFIEYAHHGHLSIDNNLIERQIRPLALGRKNYLFAGAHTGAHYAALYYSLFATCQLNGIEPFKWLNYVFSKIQEHPINRIDELIPHEGFTF